MTALYLPFRRLNIGMNRSICPACYQRPVAVNYRTKQRIYYRNRCDYCTRNNRPIKDPVPSWLKSGYRLKDKCELCNFKSRVKNQIGIWYIDGNTKNNDWTNLKSICANCRLELQEKQLGWSEPVLKPDF